MIDKLLGEWQCTAISMEGKTLASRHRLEERDKMLGLIFTLQPYGRITWNYESTIIYRERKPCPECKQRPAGIAHLLTECDTYEYEAPDMYVPCLGKRRPPGIHSPPMLKLCSWRGHTIRFKVEIDTVNGSRKMTLYPLIFKYSLGNFKFQFIRPWTKTKFDLPFDLLPALHLELFCDSEVASQDAQTEGSSSCHDALRATHHLVVAPWLKEALISHYHTIDQSRRNRVLDVILHYLYSDSLPGHVDLQTVESLATLVEKIKASKEPQGACALAPIQEGKDDLNKLLELITNYKKLHALQKDLSIRMDTIHQDINQIMIVLGGKVLNERGEVVLARNRSVCMEILTNQPRLSSTIRTVLKQMILSTLRIFQFCMKFDKIKRDLTVEEQLKLTRFIKRRLPHLVTQYTQVLKSIKIMANRMNNGLRMETASNLLPEIEELLRFFTHIILLAKDFTVIMSKVQAEPECLPPPNVCSNCNPQEKKREKEDSGIPNGACAPETLDDIGAPYQFPPMPGVSMEQLLMTKEAELIREFNNKMLMFMSYVIQEGQGFLEQPVVDKVREVNRQIEQLTDELPVIIIDFEKYVYYIQEKVPMESFAFTFTAFSSCVATLVKQFVSSSQVADPFLTLIRQTFGQDEIEECLKEMGFQDNTEQATKASSHSPSLAGGTQALDEPILTDQTTHRPEDMPCCSRSQETPNIMLPEDKDLYLNLLEPLISPPPSRSSRLAKLGFHLFETKEGADMILELHQTNSFNSQESESNFSRQMTLTESESRGDPSMEGDDTTPSVVMVPAHRVILSSRCSWFRRALTSGMKEEFEKRIVIPDADQQTFPLFLKFLYCGEYDLDMSRISIQQVVDLIFLADRYEMPSLMEVCENSLKDRIEHETVFPILNISDQFNITSLRKNCMDYLSQNKDVLALSGFADISHELKNELFNMLQWVRPKASRSRSKSEKTLYSQSYLDDMLVKPQSGATSDVHDIIPKLEDMVLSAENWEATKKASLDNCVSKMREVLGPDVPEAELVEVATACDYRLDRALEEYFNKLLLFNSTEDSSRSAKS